MSYRPSNEKDPTKINASGYLDDITLPEKTKIKRVQVLFLSSHNKWWS